MPEQVITDRYRIVKLRKLILYLAEKWFIHMPEQQLCDLVKVVGDWEMDRQC